MLQKIIFVSSFSFVFFVPQAFAVVCYTVEGAGSTYVDGTYYYLEDINGYPAYVGGYLDGYILKHGDGGADELRDYPGNTNGYYYDSTYPLWNEYLNIDTVNAQGTAPVPTITKNDPCNTGEPIASSTGATTTEGILVSGFVSLAFGLALIIFFLVLFVAGYFYNNLVKPLYD